MTKVLTEGTFRFDFTGCAKAEKIDSPGLQMPEGMRLVDFVVEETKEILLIEIKAPFSSREDTLSGELIRRKLVPKARDTYCFLHLMMRDSKPCKYVVCLGLKAPSIEPPLLLAFKDRLLARLRREAEEPWAVKYVSDCVVVTVENWETHFPKYKITRISGKA